MVAASFWSLLAPSIELSAEMGLVPWVAPLVGFSLGGAFLRLMDRILPHLHLFAPESTSEGIPTKWRRVILLVLAIEIGLQNLPEGTAVSVPLRGEGFSRPRSFWYGQLSAVVEPVAGALGAATVLFMQPLLPYALAFAAGAMIFVVVEEVVPESQQGGNTDVATLGAMIGFAVMMTLDVALG